MSENKRISNRVGLVIDIRLICEDKSEYVLKSRNISDTGVFLEYNDPPLKLPLGTNVILQVSSQLGDEPAPPVNAEVIRNTNDGMGLRFIF